MALRARPEGSIMSTLEAQGQAAKLVRRLRDHCEVLGNHVSTIHQLDTELRALMPDLSPAAQAEITGVLDGANQQLASLFTALLNPADEPA